MLEGNQISEAYSAKSLAASGEMKGNAQAIMPNEANLARNLAGSGAQDDAHAKLLVEANSTTIQPEVSSAVIRHTAHKDGKWVALTFDDGPSPKYTPQVLEILDQYNIKATFCLIGEQVNEYPNLVKQIAADGHKLCDHSMTHDEHLPGKSDERIKQEILGDKEAIQRAVPGAEVPYYRAPGGNWGGDVRQLAASWGLRSLGWSVDPRDWSRPGVESILGTIRQQLKPGGVILMHDGGGNRSQSVEALRQLIPDLKQQGYQFDFPQG